MRYGAGTVLHEYAHFRQSRRLETVLLRTLRPILHQPIEELRSEYEGNLTFEIFRIDEPEEYTSPFTRRAQNEGASGNLEGSDQHMQAEENLPLELLSSALNIPRGQNRERGDIPVLASIYNLGPVAYYPARLTNGRLYIRSITPGENISPVFVGNPEDQGFDNRIRDALLTSGERLNAEYLGFSRAYIVVFTGRRIVARVIVPLAPR